MQFEAIRQILVTSGPEDWHRPPLAFPTYRDNLQAIGDGEPIPGHYATAAYRDDVRLTIAWGMEPPGDENPIEGDNVWGEWANFPDRRVQSFLVDVFFCGALVDRHVGAAVDGHRAYLPFPHAHGFADATDYVGSGPAHPPIGWQVSESQARLFRLIDRLARGASSEYDSYLTRAGFIVSPDLDGH